MKKLSIALIVLLLSGCSTVDPYAPPSITLQPEPTYTPEPELVEEHPDSIDPKFNTCKEAIEKGFGPYTKDDPEFSWYRDPDKDGIVCEK